jgi:hypothetical protein
MANNNPFPADALQANAANRLSAEQRTWLRSLAGNSRRNSMSLAFVAAVLAVILLFFADRGGSERILFGVGLLIVAGFFFVRGFLGADRLDRDLREGYVESIEGAIAKRRVSTGGRSSSVTHWIDVEHKQMRAFKDQYDAAPDAGYVRVYYVPHSMRVVNLERLADRPGDADAIKSPMDVARAGMAGIFSFDEVKSAEARARLAAAGHAMTAGAPPPASERDPRPLAEAIVGKWTNGMITLTFNADGTVDMNLPRGAQRQAHWSVDAQGRLVADVMGKQEAGEAWIAGDRLSITEGGEGIVLKRA